MSPNSPKSNSYGVNPQPCPDCPYPMNILIVPTRVEGKIEHFAVTCRECGDSWKESIGEEDANENG